MPSAGLKSETYIFVPYFEDTESFFFGIYQAFSINIRSALDTEMRSKILDYYHKQILSVTSAFALTASLVMVMIGSGGVMPAMTTQHKVFAQPADGEETSQAGGGQQPATTIEMTPTEVNGTYRWSVDNNINPTITLVGNVNNTITVNNPTDDEHKLVIAMAVAGGAGGEEDVATTGDVDPDGQGELSITPNPGANDTLRYYCEYHPQTMLGDIRISDATTTSNQTQ